MSMFAVRIGYIQKLSGMQVPLFDWDVSRFCTAGENGAGENRRKRERLPGILYFGGMDEAMDVIKIFGSMVSRLAREDPEKARRLMLAGYRLQEKKLLLLPDKNLPPSGRYAAYAVMQNMIRALAHPENAAMVSIFVPGELLTAAGMTPYSVEAMSCFLAGTHCEQSFLARTADEGFPETMCSYHRVFLGASMAGLLPKPKCMIYTSLACDANMMTFPYLKQKEELPGFYIDVPYEKSPDSVEYVAGQLREMKRFLEDMTGRPVPEQAVLQAVERSKKAGALYRRQLLLRKEHSPSTTLTNELYTVFMCHLLAGSPEALKYTRMLLKDVKAAPGADGVRILWMHLMPFLQEPVKAVFNYSANTLITACDFVCDGFRKTHYDAPYEALAEKMVYSIYNGSVKDRIRLARKLAEATGADGAILFAHWGCKATIGASGLIKRSLEASGLPAMVLDGDGCNPANTGDGQTATRLQAFLEMLRAGKAAEPASEMTGAGKAAKTASETAGAGKAAKTVPETAGAGKAVKTVSETAGAGKTAKTVSEMAGAGKTAKTVSETVGAAETAETAPETAEPGKTAGSLPENAQKRMEQNISGDRAPETAGAKRGINTI